MTECPLNIVLVNQDDGNEFVSDVNEGNYVFLHTGVEDCACKMKITVELDDGETVTTYFAELDDKRQLVREYTKKECTDELIMRILEEYAEEVDKE